MDEIKITNADAARPAVRSTAWLEGKKLYIVTVERSIVVAATDENGAEREARRNEHEELYNEPEMVIARALTRIEQVPEEWRDCLPYGLSGDRSIKELLSL